MPSADLPLLCPVCSRPLEYLPAEATHQPRLSCPEGHNFDVARQGYFNLLVGKGTPFEPDSAAMVASRFAFLGNGHYAPLAHALASAVVPLLREEGAVVLDSGTGTGHYLREILDAAATAGRPASAIGLDISKFALRRAARLNPEAVHLVWDIWRPLPVAENSVDAVTVVFAPRNPEEFARVLRPGGVLAVVTPRPGHLAGIAAVTGMLGIEEGKDERLADAMAGHFEPKTSLDVDIPLTLGRAAAADLAFMGPAGHHLDRDQITARLESSAEPVRDDARFRISVFRPRAQGAP
ncbi:methyltransferase domain-containing protein [Pseudarthrobacter sp. NIBRBAC000502771]|uniref:methyltransferase domain-containing protein n=1 Tax=Pseudarthrobacter sp. NIBRBAC000502771 TaxID=2590774 RepID=UPI0011320543|nr:methyltransferase domain-containing protein [Pseudarthrobacter sp. NIBRBAC000502771]QDG63465.1 methyltransferase domain-containing protein [Pseudarthrobacter sp. NIBRBAC000502771]